VAALVYRYPDLIDSGDFDGIGVLFAHAVLRSGDSASIRGSDELVPMLKRLVRTYEDGRTCTKHVVTNLVIEVADDRSTATAKSYITVMQARPPEFPLQIIASNRHFDRFERVDGVWRFAERVDVQDLAGDMSRHITGSY
jgi:SnoaL-like domain